VCEKSITNSQPFVKKNEKNIRSPGGGIFLTHTVFCVAGIGWRTLWCCQRYWRWHTSNFKL